MAAGADQSDDSPVDSVKRPCSRPCGSHICFPQIDAGLGQVCNCQCREEVHAYTAPAGLSASQVIPIITAEDDDGHVSLTPGGQEEILSVRSYVPMVPYVAKDLSQSHESFLRRLELIAPQEAEAEAAVGAEAGVEEERGGSASAALEAPPDFSDSAGHSAAQTLAGSLFDEPSDELAPEPGTDPDCGCPPENEGLSGPLGPCCQATENKCYRWPFEKMEEIAADIAHLHPLFIPCSCCEGREEVMQRRKTPPRPPPSAPPHPFCRLCRVQRGDDSSCPCKRMRLNVWNERTGDLMSRPERGGASGDTSVLPIDDMQQPEQLPPEPDPDAALPPGFPPPKEDESADRLSREFTASDEDLIELWLQQAKSCSERMEKVLEELTQKVTSKDPAAPWREPEVLRMETLAPEPGRPQGIGIQCRDKAAVEGKLAPSSCVYPIECNSKCALAGKPPPLSLEDFEFVLFDKTPPPDKKEEDTETVHTMGSLYIAAGNVLGSLLKIPSVENVEEHSEQEVTSWKESESMNSSKISEATTEAYTVDVPKEVSIQLFSPAVSRRNINEPPTAVAGLSVSEILPLPGQNSQTTALEEKDGEQVCTNVVKCINTDMQKEKAPVDSSPTVGFNKKVEIPQTPTSDISMRGKQIFTHDTPMFVTSTSQVDLKIKPRNTDFSWKDSFKSRAMELIQQDIPSVSKNVYHVRTQDMHVAEVEYSEDGNKEKIVRRGEWDEEEKIMPETESSSTAISTPLAIERTHARIHEIELLDEKCSKVETEMSWHQRFVMFPPPGYSDNAARLADDDDKLYLLFRKMDARLQQQEELQGSVVNNVCVTSWSEKERVLPSNAEMDMSNRTPASDNIIERTVEGVKTESVNTQVKDIRSFKKSSWKETEKEIRQGEEDKIIVSRTGESEEMSGPDSYKRHDVINDVSKEPEYHENPMGAMDALLTKMQSTFDNLRSTMHAQAKTASNGQQKMEPTTRARIGQPPHAPRDVKIPSPTTAQPSPTEAAQISGEAYVMETISEGEIKPRPPLNTLAKGTREDQGEFSLPITSSQYTMKISPNESNAETSVLKTVVESTKSNIFPGTCCSSVFTIMPVATAVSAPNHVASNTLLVSPSLKIPLVNNTPKLLQLGTSKEESELIRSFLREETGTNTKVVESKHKIKVDASVIISEVSESEEIRGSTQSAIGSLGSLLTKGEKVSQMSHVPTLSDVVLQVSSTENILESPINVNAQLQTAHTSNLLANVSEAALSHQSNDLQRSAGTVSKVNGPTASRVAPLLENISPDDIEARMQFNVSVEEREAIKKYLENEAQEVESAVLHEDVKQSVVHIRTQLTTAEPNIVLYASLLGSEGINSSLTEKCKVVCNFNDRSGHKLPCNLKQEDAFSVDTRSLTTPLGTTMGPTVASKILTGARQPHNVFKNISKDKVKSSNFFSQYNQETYSSLESDVDKSMPFAASMKDTNTIRNDMKNDAQDGDATPPPNYTSCTCKHIDHELSAASDDAKQEVTLISSEFSQVVLSEPQEILWSDLQMGVDSTEQSGRQEYITNNPTEFCKNESINVPFLVTSDKEFISLDVCEEVPEEYQVKENVNTGNAYYEHATVLTTTDIVPDGVLDAANEREESVRAPQDGDLHRFMKMDVSSEMDNNAILNVMNILPETLDTEEYVVENKDVAFQYQDKVQNLCSYNTYSEFVTVKNNKDPTIQIPSREPDKIEIIRSRTDVMEKIREEDITDLQTYRRMSGIILDEYTNHTVLPFVSQIAPHKILDFSAGTSNELKSSMRDVSGICMETTEAQLIESNSDEEIYSESVQEERKSVTVTSDINKKIELKLPLQNVTIIQIIDSKSQGDQEHTEDILKHDDIIYKDIKSSSIAHEEQKIFRPVQEMSPNLSTEDERTEISLEDVVLVKLSSTFEPEIVKEISGDIDIARDKSEMSDISSREEDFICNQHVQNTLDTIPVPFVTLNNLSLIPNVEVKTKDKTAIATTDNKRNVNDTDESDNKTVGKVPFVVLLDSDKKYIKDNVEITLSMPAKDFCICVQGSEQHSDMEKFEGTIYEGETVKDVIGDDSVKVTEMLSIENKIKSDINNIVTSQAESDLHYIQGMPLNEVSVRGHYILANEPPEKTVEVETDKYSCGHLVQEIVQEIKPVKLVDKVTKTLNDVSSVLPPLSEESEIKSDVRPSLNIAKYKENIIESNIKTYKFLKVDTIDTSQTETIYAVQKINPPDAKSLETLEENKSPTKPTASPELKGSESSRTSRKPCLPPCPRRRGISRTLHRSHRPRPKVPLANSKGRKQLPEKQRVKQDYPTKKSTRPSTEQPASSKADRSPQAVEAHATNALSARESRVSWASGDSTLESAAAERRDLRNLEPKTEWVFRSISDLLERIARDAPKALRPLQWSRRLKLISRNTREVQCTLRDLTSDAELMQLYRPGEHPIVPHDSNVHFDGTDDFTVETLMGARRKLTAEEAKGTESTTSRVYHSSLVSAEGDEYAEYLLKKYRKSRPSQLPGHYASQISPLISTTHAPTIERSTRKHKSVVKLDEKYGLSEHDSAHTSNIQPDVLGEKALSSATLESSVFFNVAPEFLSTVELETTDHENVSYIQEVVQEDTPFASELSPIVEEAPFPDAGKKPESNATRPKAPSNVNYTVVTAPCKVTLTSDLPLTNIFCLCGEYDLLDAACDCGICPKETRDHDLPPEDRICTCPRSKDRAPECEDEICGMNLSDTDGLSASDAGDSFITATDARDTSSNRSQALTDDEKLENREESEQLKVSATESAASGESITASSILPDESLSSRLDEDRSFRGKHKEEIIVPERLYRLASPVGRPQSAPAMAGTALDSAERPAPDGSSAGGSGVLVPEGASMATSQASFASGVGMGSKRSRGADGATAHAQRGHCCAREQCCCELDIITAQLRIELQSLRERLMRSTREAERLRLEPSSGSDLETAPSDCCALLNSLLLALGSLRTTDEESSWAAEDLPPPPPPPDLLPICASTPELVDGIVPSLNQNTEKSVEPAGSTQPDSRAEQLDEHNETVLPTRVSRLSSREMLIFAKNFLEDDNFSENQKKEYLERISPWLELIPDGNEDISAGDILWHARRLSTVLEESISLLSVDMTDVQRRLQRFEPMREEREGETNTATNVDGPSSPSQGLMTQDSQRVEDNTLGITNDLTSQENTLFSQPRTQTANRTNSESPYDVIITRDVNRTEPSSRIGQHHLPQDVKASGFKSSTNSYQSEGIQQQSNTARRKCVGVSCKREKLNLSWDDHISYVRSRNTQSTTSKTPFNKEQTDAEVANRDASAQKVNALYSPLSAPETSISRTVNIGGHIDAEAAGSPAFRKDHRTSPREDLIFSHTKPVTAEDTTHDSSYNTFRLSEGHEAIDVRIPRSSYRKDRRTSPREDLIFSYKEVQTNDEVPESSYNTFHFDDGQPIEESGRGSFPRKKRRTSPREDLIFSYITPNTEEKDTSFNVFLLDDSQSVAEVAERRSSYRKEPRNSPREDLIFSYTKPTTVENTMSEPSYNTFSNDQPVAEVGHSPTYSQKNVLLPQKRTCKKISRVNTSDKSPSSPKIIERNYGPTGSSQPSFTPTVTEGRSLKTSWLPQSCYRVFTALWNTSVVSKFVSQATGRTQKKLPPWDATRVASLVEESSSAARHFEIGGFASGDAAPEADVGAGAEAEAVEHSPRAPSALVVPAKRHRRRRAVTTLQEHQECPREDMAAETAGVFEAEPQDMAQAELRVVDSESLLLRWPLVEGAIGYEIFLNGKLRQKVYSGTRGQAALLDLDLKQRQHVAVYPRLVDENGAPKFSASAIYTPSDK